MINEASLYAERRTAAVDRLLEGPEGNASIELVTAFVEELLEASPSVILGFEDIDGDRLGGPVHGRLADRGFNIAVSCFWLDKKLVKLPHLALVTQVLQEYVEPVDECIDHLIIITATLDPEPIAAILYRITERTVPSKVTVISLLSSPRAVQRLVQNLDPVNAVKLRIQSVFNEERYGEEDFHDTSDTRTPTIQRLPTAMAMPKIIADRLGFGPPPPEITRTYEV